MYIKVASASELLQCGITCSMALPCYALLSMVEKYVMIRFFPAIDAAHSMTPVRYNDKFKRPR